MPGTGTAASPGTLLDVLGEPRFNASVPLFAETPASDLVDHQIRRERLFKALSVIFGAFAALLCSLGIYGLLSYLVGSRRSEIGVRMALGAQRSRIASQILGETLRPMLAGLAGGIVAAYAMTRYVEAMLFGVSRLDVVSIGGAVLLFVTIGAIAAVLPARRAARLEPVAVLRSE